MKLQKHYIIIVGGAICLGGFASLLYSDFKSSQGYFGQSSILDNIFNINSSNSYDQDTHELQDFIQQDRIIKNKIRTNLAVLMDAVEHNNAAQVQTILQNMRMQLNKEQFQLFIDTLDNDGYSALHRAAAENSYEIMEQLLSSGANPNVRFIWPDNSIKQGKLFDLLDGCTPLHVIMQNFSHVNADNRECFALMLEFNPNLKLKNLAGDSLLHILAQSNNPNAVDFIKVLHVNGLNANEKDVYGKTPLQLLAESSAANKAQIANALIQAGAVGSMPKNNSDKLPPAVLSNHPKIAKFEQMDESKYFKNRAE